jgi:hypothetical protein
MIICLSHGVPTASQMHQGYFEVQASVRPRNRVPGERVPQPRFAKPHSSCFEKKNPNREHDSVEDARAALDLYKVVSARIGRKSISAGRFICRDYDFPGAKSPGCACRGEDKTSQDDSIEGRRKLGRACARPRLRARAPSRWTASKNSSKTPTGIPFPKSHEFSH